MFQLPTKGSETSLGYQTQPSLLPPLIPHSLSSNLNISQVAEANGLGGALGGGSVEPPPPPPIPPPGTEFWDRLGRGVAETYGGIATQIEGGNAKRDGIAKVWRDEQAQHRHRHKRYMSELEAVNHDLALQFSLKGTLTGKAEAPSHYPALDVGNDVFLSPTAPQHRWQR